MCFIIWFQIGINVFFWSQSNSLDCFIQRIWKKWESWISRRNSVEISANLHILLFLAGKTLEFGWIYWFLKTWGIFCAFTCNNCKSFALSERMIQRNEREFKCRRLGSFLAVREFEEIFLQILQILQTLFVQKNQFLVPSSKTEGDAKQNTVQWSLKKLIQFYILFRNFISIIQQIFLVRMREQKNVIRE